MPGPAVSVHFVNNVLAAAAGYIEDEPDTARDVLAELGAFLTHRLRPPRVVTLRDELEHVAIYLRLQQARFPGRIETSLAEGERAPATALGAGDLQAPVAAALDGWLTRRPGPVRIALELRGAGLRLTLDAPGAGDVARETVLVELPGTARDAA